MVRINNKRVMIDRNYKDIEISANSIMADQFLEIATTKDVRLESIVCSGIKIVSRKIFLDGEIVSHGQIILAAEEIHINKEARAM
ncbi:hypothetical protein FACS1894122_09050 [Alphaproteobacteria bacterium]|nr:hypothetical protein FACS1894122_09050 [Alphaproteobacteria bacterium]